MTTVSQNPELLNHLVALLVASRLVFGQERVYARVVALVVGEIMVFARHTVTQLLMTLGLTEQDWSAWYRLFSEGRFDAEAASRVLVKETLAHVAADEVYVVAGDGTQTPRSSRKIEGTGWLRNLRTPPFMVGIHYAQRWFNGSWLMPADRATGAHYLCAGCPVSPKKQLARNMKRAKNGKQRSISYSGYGTNWP